MPERPSMEEIKKMMLRHAQLQMQYKGEYLGIREMRKHVSWYTTGLPNSARRCEMKLIVWKVMRSWKFYWKKDWGNRFCDCKKCPIKEFW